MQQWYATAAKVVWQCYSCAEGGGAPARPAGGSVQQMVRWVPEPPISRAGAQEARRSVTASVGVNGERV
jgi:hypothetical protein